MLIKSIVGFAIYLAIFLAGSILIFGLINSNFNLIYFIFAGILLISLVYYSKEVFDKKRDFFVAIFLALLIAGSLAYTMDGAKNYSDNLNKLKVLNNNLSEEINNLSRNNEYYNNYIEYLITQISSTQGNSIKILGDINSITANAIANQPPPVNNIVNNYVTNNPPTSNPVTTSQTTSTTSNPTSIQSSTTQTQNNRERENDD